MKIQEIMDKEVEKAEPELSVTEAARRMASEDVGYLLIVEGSKLVGIITEEDIIKKVVSEGKDPHETKVADIMVTEVIHTEPDVTLEDAAQVMTDRKIKKLPVVDGKHLLGIVTAEHVVSAEPKMMQHLGELIVYAKKQKKIAG